VELDHNNIDVKNVFKGFLFLKHDFNISYFLHVFGFLVGQNFKF